MYRLALAIVTLLCMGDHFANLSPAPHFASAELLSATDVQYPVRSVAVGTVVLELTVDEKGVVDNVHPVREIQTLTNPAITSVKTWQFKPAFLDGKPTPSRIAVAVMFNSVAAYPLETALGPISPTEAESESALEPQPIKVIAATFVRYPPHSVTTGTVILRATIDAEGFARDVVAVRDVPALTEPCIEALKKWKFQPAELQGNPISSSISVAFVLRPPYGS